MPEKLTEQRIFRIINLLSDKVEQEESAFSKLDQAAADEVIADWYKIVEIAHYIRRGGISAMIYRLETGHLELVPSDYFDEASRAIGEHYSGKVTPPESSKHQLVARLREVDESEEKAVANCLFEIDEFVLSGARSSAEADITRSEADHQ